MTTGQEHVGSAAEEAARLLDALQDWARRSTEGLGERVATGSPECTLCPFCQLLGLVRSAEPEVFGHLSDAAQSLMAALRVAMAAHERQWQASRSAPVQRIDIG